MQIGERLVHRGVERRSLACTEVRQARIGEYPALDVLHYVEHLSDDGLVRAQQQHLRHRDGRACECPMTVNSRSTACADGSSTPGGFLRST